MHRALRVRGRGKQGFSIVETLVVLAIISVLLLMLSTGLIKALRMAKSTAAGEEMRVESIGAQAKAVHEGNETHSPEKVVQRARNQFRQVGQQGMQRIVSRVLFVVQRDIEFRAYYHTLLNPANTKTPEFTSDGELIAFTEHGERFELPPIGGEVPGGAHIIAWEFISTSLSETGRGDAGGNVIYSDGRREYVPYPAKFPMSKSVALLSHEFVGNFHE